MVNSKRQALKNILLTHFLPCFLLGLTTISFIHVQLDESAGLLESMRSMRFYLNCVINGLLDAALIVGFHSLQNYRHRKKNPLAVHWTPLSMPHSPQEIWAAGVVAFFAGSVSIILVLFPEGLVVTTILVLFLIYEHLRFFFRRVGQILAPDCTATWKDVGTFFFTYGTILGAFAMINASMELIHGLMEETLPFGFASDSSVFIDSLYFTTVTMTTLGFGDITPKTPDAKLLITAECLIGYVMFALMVGCITKGVIHQKR